MMPFTCSLYSAVSLWYKHSLCKFQGITLSVGHHISPYIPVQGQVHWCIQQQQQHRWWSQCVSLCCQHWQREQSNIRHGSLRILCHSHQLYYTAAALVSADRTLKSYKSRGWLSRPNRVSRRIETFWGKSRKPELINLCIQALTGAWLTLCSSVRLSFIHFVAITIHWAPTGNSNSQENWLVASGR